MTIFRVRSSIDMLMIIHQIGGSFELLKQIGEVFCNFFLGYIPRTAFYCILMVTVIGFAYFSIFISFFQRMKFSQSVSFSRSYPNSPLLTSDIFGLLKTINQRIKTLSKKILYFLSMRHCSLHTI